MSEREAGRDDVRLSLGAYVLGALEPADQSMVERHVRSCPDCAAEVNELTGLVPILASTPAEDLIPPSVSDDLFGRVVAAIDSADRTPRRVQPAARRWRSTRSLLAVAAAAVILAGAGTAVGLSLESSHPEQTTATADAGGVTLSVSASDETAGTALRVRVDGLPQNERCHLVALAADGSRHEAGTWNATYAGHAQVVESTDVPRANLRRLALYGTDGHLLVAVNL